MATNSKLAEMIERHGDEILQDWLDEQKSVAVFRTDLMPEAELRQQAKEFLNALCISCRDGDPADMVGSHWERMRALLEDISCYRANHGFTSSETALFLFSIKQPFYAQCRKEFDTDINSVTAEMFLLSNIIENLGLYITEMYIKSKEEIIKRQQDEMLELSTPVVKIWDHIIAIPLIGTLDSGRTQVVTENLLKEIVNTGADIAILDITGVPAVDTLVAQHLLMTVAAARLMGAECIISGIRPQIAQTMVHLGVTFKSIVTKATLADAIKYSFAKLGLRITRVDAKS